MRMVFPDQEAAGNLPLYSVVCIAGAGRGPLVSRCISALARAQRKANIFVVEKNPNAFVTYDVS